MTTLEDARKAYAEYLQTDANDYEAIIANTKKAVTAYAKWTHDALFRVAFRPAEAAFAVAGALIAARGVRDALDDDEIDFVDMIVASAAVVVENVKKEVAE